MYERANTYPRWLIPAHAGKTGASAPTIKPTRAHPRSRGENDVKKGTHMPTLGSSPLTRGKRAPAASAEIDPRLIPAHAGKTNRQQCSALAWGAHPRSRGENAMRASRRARALGSSPLTRGKHPDARVAWTSDGLIPAHAGKTSSLVTIIERRTAHPRSRGENELGAGQFRLARGSSPLTRGKQARVFCGELVRGLIPAHAGKTPGRCSSPNYQWAHPRSRGENQQAAAGFAHGPGLIPAHAGKTMKSTASSWLIGAHPRSRGENSFSTRALSVSSGSSPLTRGKLSRDVPG